MSDEIRVVALTRIRAGSEAAMEQAARACVQETRKEPGCIAYACHRDLSDPGRFAFIETWKDQEALERHRGQPHLLALKAALEPIAEGALQIMVFKEID